MGIGRMASSYPSRGCASCRGPSDPQHGPPALLRLAGWHAHSVCFPPGSPGGDQTILSGAVKSCVYMSPQELKEGFVCPHGLLHTQCPLKDGFILVSDLPLEITDSQWLSEMERAWRSSSQYFPNYGQNSVGRSWAAFSWGTDCFNYRIL